MAEKSFPQIVSSYQVALMKMVLAAREHGVIVEVRVEPKPNEPLRMGNHISVVACRSVWENAK